MVRRDAGRAGVVEAAARATRGSSIACTSPCATRPAGSLVAAAGDARPRHLRALGREAVPGAAVARGRKRRPDGARCRGDRDRVRLARGRARSRRQRSTALLAAAGVGLADLRLAACIRRSATLRRASWQRAGRGPGTLHHNCSGNHALALAHVRRGVAGGGLPRQSMPRISAAVHAGVEALAGEVPHLAERPLRHARPTDCR